MKKKFIIPVLCKFIFVKQFNLFKFVKKINSFKFVKNNSFKFVKFKFIEFVLPTDGTLPRAGLLGRCWCWYHGSAPNFIEILIEFTWLNHCFFLYRCYPERDWLWSRIRDDSRPGASCRNLHRRWCRRWGPVTAIRRRSGRSYRTLCDKLPTSWPIQRTWSHLHINRLHRQLFHLLLPVAEGPTREELRVDALLLAL